MNNCYFYLSMCLYCINTKFIILFIITFHSILCDNSIYKLPFGLFYSFEKNNSIELIKYIFDNFIYVNLTIGTPPQIIPFQLDINSQTFYVSNKYFNRNASSTYELLSKEENFYSYEDAISGFNSKDILNINGVKKKINFIYETKNKKDNDLGNLGLLIPTKFQSNVYSFFNTLKISGFINSFIWTLKFNDNINMKDIIYHRGKYTQILGDFIIGDNPHNYEKNKELYNKDKYIQFDAIWSENNLYWDIEFYKIYLKFNNNQTQLNDNNTNIINIHGNRLAEINPDVGFIVAPIEYFNIINQNYFYKKNECKTIKIANSLLRYIECDNSKGFNISSFPDIYFQHDKNDFVLTYKDLFILDKNKNKYIFLIFYEGYTGNWVFGRLFLAKYQLTFNEQTKKIGYYSFMNDIHRKKVKIFDKKRIIAFICNFLRILFLTFFIVLIIYSLCIKNKKRKKRINELDEENDDEKVKNNNLLNNIEDKNNI